MNCRLPQTPRTPSSAASHYFDDTFLRQRRASLGGRRASGIARSQTRRRSIGNVSDKAGTENGDADGDGDDDGEGGFGGPNGAPSRTWTIYKNDEASAPGQAEEKRPHYEDPDDPINRYVAEQLERLRVSEGREWAEELGTDANGA